MAVDAFTATRHTPLTIRGKAHKRSATPECGRTVDMTGTNTLAALAAALFAGSVAMPVALAQFSQQPTPVQQPFPPGQNQRPQAQSTQPKSPAKAQPAAPRQTDPTAAPAATSDGQLRQRVEQLEEQLVDMQVVIGTLESLARQSGSGGAAPARGGGPAGLSGPDAGRLAALETQIQALTAQLEQMSDQLRNARAGGGFNTSPRATRDSAWHLSLTGIRRWLWYDDRHARARPRSHRADPRRPRSRPTQPQTSRSQTS